jgi:hypothetical protein
MLLDDVRREITKATRRLFVDFGVEVDDQGRLVFKQCAHAMGSAERIGFYRPVPEA